MLMMSLIIVEFSQWQALNNSHLLPRIKNCKGMLGHTAAWEASPQHPCHDHIIRVACWKGCERRHHPCTLLPPIGSSQLDSLHFETLQSWTRVSRVYPPPHTLTQPDNTLRGPDNPPRGCDTRDRWLAAVFPDSLVVEDLLRGRSPRVQLALRRHPNPD